MGSSWMGTAGTRAVVLVEVRWERPNVGIRLGNEDIDVADDVCGGGG